MAANVLDTIVLFGDSITQQGWVPNGFAQRLAYVYARKLDVINRGLSGYNTEWAVPVFEQMIAKRAEQEHVPRIALLTIWFGANDACIPPSPQHLPIPRYKHNLTHFIRLLRSPSSAYYAPSTRIVLFTPPPINTIMRRADLATREPPQALDRDFEVTRAYAEAVREVGRSEGVSVLDVWTAFYEAAGRDEQQLERFTYDGLHLNTVGYKMVFELLMEKIKTEFPELHYENLTEVFAPWAQIDFQNPQASLQARRTEL